jgi:nitrogenase-stabilizing/protective protein
MGQIEQFYKLRDCEDYFRFFGIEYDKHLIEVKRFHILKEYGTLIKDAFQKYSDDEGSLMKFLNYSLLKVYGAFKSGYNPSAAEIWQTHLKKGGCGSCASSQGGSCGC